VGDRVIIIFMSPDDNLGIVVEKSNNMNFHSYIGVLEKEKTYNIEILVDSE
jgi:hypothetical protein